MGSTNSIKIPDQILKDIPLAEHMGLKNLREASEQNQSAEWLLPLLKNTNHLQTMFGGSLYTACAVSCYSVVLFLKLKNLWSTNEVVIASGNIRYLAPVKGDAKIIANVVEQDGWNQKRAKIKMKAEVFYGNTLAAVFEGLYFISRDS